MRLSKFEIHNFKGIQSAAFEWEDIVVLIGENNCGKSTVLQALEYFLGGSQLKDQLLFFDAVSDVDHAIELMGFFDELSEGEQRSQAVRGRMFEGRWILKKMFWSEIDEGGNLTWKEHYSSYCGEDVFANWPEKDAAWSNFPPEYEPLIARLPSQGTRSNESSRQKLRELVRDNRPDLITQGAPQWIPNPGGGGNWKSNANSIIPRLIYVKAVHDVGQESTSRAASSYGKIVSLIVEKKLMARPEIIALKGNVQAALRLFNPDPEHPEWQAPEIRDLQDRINKKLNEVIGGHVAIRTSEVDIEPILMPSTHLVLRDRPDALETAPEHQGHGLQRTLIMTLLQILAEIQSEPTESAETDGSSAVPTRATILAVEEPELYMHPQMERKMRDVLYRLATESRIQVICTTHSPVFIDIATSQKTIVRLVKEPDRTVRLFQVETDIFAGTDAASERERLSLIARFHPTVNELFFARRVVLLEEQSAIAAFERAGEITDLFQRHANLRRDVALIDCHGKPSIPAFQRVLNAFDIPYTVVHDEDQGNAVEQARNMRIAALLATPTRTNLRYLISPTDLEQMLNYPATKDKPYQALRRVEELHSAGNLPSAFLEALNWVYFGGPDEP